MIEIGVVIAVLIGMAEVAKRSFKIPSNYIPLFNLVLGIASGFFIVDGTAFEQVVTGAIIGLSASGLYDQSKIIKK